MTDAVRFLTFDEAIAIHERLIERFGGPSGIRDPGLLESALYRPQTGYYGDIAEMAAALFESLLMNHPFVDGNKRVAFFSVDVFLRMNGWRLDVEPGPAHAFLIGLLERNECDFERLLPWLRDAMRQESEADPRRSAGIENACWHVLRYPRVSHPAPAETPMHLLQTLGARAQLHRSEKGKW